MCDSSYLDFIGNNQINMKIDRNEFSLEGIALVTLDVESMYNFMSEDLARGACKEFLEEANGGHGDEIEVSSRSILKALDLCIKSNFFHFNEQIYHQTGGVGTGIKLAPPYACLGMGKYEKITFNSDSDFLEKIMLWKRFIDDVLMLFDGTQEECAEFVTWLNSIIPGVIKFKYEYSTEMVEFLDLKIFVENGRLETDLYIKPSNLQLYLDFFSNHPEPCKEGVVYGQALRVVERCSRTEDREKHLENLKNKLVNRNYPEKLIEEKFNIVRKKSRRDLINQKRKRNTGDDKVRLIFTHNRGNPPLHSWLRESKKCLLKNEKAKRIGDKIQICHSQPKNLKSLLTQKVQKKDTGDLRGCFKCSKCRVSCPIMKEGDSFTSTNTGRTYPIKQMLDCNSSFVIYLATCKRCRGQYVGKSTTIFKKRHSNHKQEIKREYGGLGHHYGGKGCGYENLSMQIIDQVDQGDQAALARQEVYWQNQLRGYVQNGGHAHCYRKEKHPGGV